MTSILRLSSLLIVLLRLSAVLFGSSGNRSTCSLLSLILDISIPAFIFTNPSLCSVIKILLSELKILFDSFITN